MLVKEPCLQSQIDEPALDDPIQSDESMPASNTPSWLSDHVRSRRWPLLFAALFVVSGMVFMFTWLPLAHHEQSWAVGGDTWGIYRGAQYVSWGDLGGIYNQGTGIVAFPGMEILLTPVALIGDHLGLVSSYGPFTVPRPSAALILMPVELLLASTVIFAADALAQRLNVLRRRRIWMCLLVGVVAWPTAAIWGHAEDSLAITFAVYAMVAMMDRKWARMGWLFGLGIVFQPLVGLMLPLFIGCTPRGQRMALAIRSLALSAFLVLVAFAGDASDAYRSLIQQPTPPSLNHATPWASLSPVLQANAGPKGNVAGLVPGTQVGHIAVQAASVTGQSVQYVSGGPGRMIDVVLAVLIGIYVWRRPQSPLRILWLASVVLASRCFFEPVMTPYYLAPPLIVCLVMASRQGGKRFWPAVIIALEVTVFAYHHLNPWAWWLPVVAGLAAILALGYPGGRLVGREEPEASGDNHIDEESDEWQAAEGADRAFVPELA